MIITFESRKKSFPGYVLLISYAVLALFFSDRWKYLAGVGLSLILFLGSYSVGKRLSFVLFKTADQTLFFPLGLGCVLAVSYGCFSYATSPLVFYLLWGTLGILSVFEVPILAYRFSRSYAWGGPFLLFAFWSAFTPTIFAPALSYEIGVPDQYLALGKMMVLPEHLYTSLPPFGQVLGLLFAGLNSETGMKAFFILIYFQIISLLVSLLRWLITEPVIGAANEADRNYQTDLLYMARTELLVTPMLVLPSALILIHFAAYDLLVSLFFCAGIASLLKEFDLLSYRKIFPVALLLSFGLWTGYSVLLFIFPLFILWLALSHWRISRDGQKLLFSLYGMILLLWMPLLIRNAMILGDPFYPALAGILDISSWSPSQSVVLVRNTMSGGAGLSDVLLTPLLLLVAPDYFGPGAQIGIILLVSILLYPFAKKLRTVNHILIYVTFCYLFWLFTLKAFHHFLPAFFLLYLMSYFAFRHLHIRFPRYIWVFWLAMIVHAIFCLLPVLKQQPLIAPNQKQVDYLRQHLDYYPLAETVNVYDSTGKVLFLGETRLAHFEKPAMASTVCDQSVLLKYIKESSSAEKLHETLQRGGIKLIVYNQESFDQAYGDEGVVRLSQSQLDMVSSFLAQFTHLEQESGGIRLYEVRDSHGW